jgi:osmotically-inducible protein OsmY
MKRLGINDAAATRREIMRNDAAHNGTMQRLFGVQWTDPSLYALVLNTARTPVADCVELITRLAASAAFQETPQSRAALSDELVLSRVRAAIERQFGSGMTTLGGIDATVSAGKVTLTGATSDERTIVEIVRLVHGIEGVTGVESRIAHIAFRPSM